MRLSATEAVDKKLRGPSQGHWREAADDRYANVGREMSGGGFTDQGECSVGRSQERRQGGQLRADTAAGSSSKTGANS